MVPTNCSRVRDEKRRTDGQTSKRSRLELTMPWQQQNTTRVKKKHTGTTPNRKQTTHLHNHRKDDKRRSHSTSSNRTIHQTFRMPSAEDQLARVAGRELTESEVNCLISNFSSQAQYISQNTVRDSYLHSLFIKIQRMVKTNTKTKIK